MDTTVAGTEAAAVPGEDAPAEAVTLDVDAFNLACARKGAYRIGERARLVGVDRTTLDNWTRGPVAVRLDVAFRVATKLDLTVHDLWGPAMASAA